jgi:hypothetical protein
MIKIGSGSLNAVDMEMNEAVEQLLDQNLWSHFSVVPNVINEYARLTRDGIKNHVVAPAGEI